MATQIKNLADILINGETTPSPEWQLRIIQSDQCFSYVAWNEKTKEALIVDPKDEDIAAYRTIHNELKEYLWIAIIDTHTHADHISVAATLAEELKAPLLMHALAPSQRVHLRIAKSTVLPTRAAPLHLILTPGHTKDSITPLWGPYLFGGDTILFGDTGRDDLPGGDSEDHYRSIETLKNFANPTMIVLPGHDHKGGQASSWGTQLKINSSLTQSQDDFIKESNAFDAPAPELLKKSLRENFK